MENNEDLRKLVTTAISHLSSDNGWHNLATLGATIKKIDPSFAPDKYGFQKLREVLESIPEVIDIKHDTNTPPACFAKLCESSLVPLTTNQVKSASNQKRVINSRSNEETLDGFAYMKSPRSWEDLANMALTEKWYFGEEVPTNFKYPILSNYLRYTFVRLRHENKVSVVNDEIQRASFNTGLVDKRFQPIYAFFQPNSNPNQQRWELSSFCISGEGRDGKDLVRHFKSKPESAYYFAKTEDMFFNIEAGVPDIDWKHILVDNVDRLPLNFVSEVGPRAFNPRDCSNIYDKNELKEYKNSFKQAVESDDRSYRDLIRRLDDALDVALRRVKWNYKTAIPMYYPRGQMMSLLLPLGLLSDESIDVALVVERTQSGNYLGHTILPLNWAYNNARLVCRPDSDWLTPQLINDTGTEDDSTE